MSVTKVGIRLVFIFAKRIIKFFYHDTKVIGSFLRRNRLLEPSIVNIIGGTKTHHGGKYAIFLIWQPGGLPWYVMNAITALNNLGVNIIAVINHDISAETRTVLEDRCHTMLIRDNVGLDFGGYKDGSIFLSCNVSDIEKVIYMNDSVYYFKDKLSDFFGSLLYSSCEVCGSFENEEKNYHIQSFCFSVSKEMFLHQLFQKFWNDYLPVSSRLWAINQGEIALSRTMLTLNPSLEIIYNANNLIPCLEVRDIQSIMTINRYLPKRQRFKEEELHLLADNPFLLVQRIRSRSQIHTGAFIFRKYMDCPLIKRDLVYRLQFTPSELKQLLIELGYEDEGVLALKEMENKGTPTQLSLIKQLRVAVGIL